MPEDPTPIEGGTDKTFTQADVDRIVADRLTRERAKFADYDDLKAKADRVGQLESELQQATGTIDAAEQRADEAESRALRTEVALSKGFTAVQAKHLSGTSKEELEASADELLATFGTPPGGNLHVPREGETPSGPKEDEMREFARNLFQTAE